MPELLLIRHATTDWNRDKRLQGRRDIPLNEDGIAALQGCCPPAPFTAARWYCSPLLRARQTAACLGLTDVQLEPALIEMDWGAWEGRRVRDLRRALGESMRDNEARGLDMQPPGGESPRQVMERLQPWLARMAQEPAAGVGAVTHKGVIRAALALATGWDMTGNFSTSIDWHQGLLFSLTPTGELRLVAVNVPLGASA